MIAVLIEAIVNRGDEHLVVGQLTQHPSSIRPTGDGITQIWFQDIEDRRGAQEGAHVARLVVEHFGDDSSAIELWVPPNWFSNCLSSAPRWSASNANRRPAGQPSVRSRSAVASVAPSDRPGSPCSKSATASSAVNAKSTPRTSARSPAARHLARANGGSARETRIRCSPSGWCPISHSTPAQQSPSRRWASSTTSTIGCAWFSEPNEIVGQRRHHLVLVDLLVADHVDGVERAARVGELGGTHHGRPEPVRVAEAESTSTHDQGSARCARYDRTRVVLPEPGGPTTSERRLPTSGPMRVSSRRRRTWLAGNIGGENVTAGMWALVGALPCQRWGSHSPTVATVRPCPSAYRPDRAMSPRPGRPQRGEA